MATNNKTGDPANVPKTRAAGPDPKHNPPIRPADTSKQHPGPIEIGHHARYTTAPSKSRGKI
jgi:hypothetical protein